MTDRQPAIFLDVAEGARRFVPELPRPAGLIDSHPDDRLDRKLALAERGLEQLAEKSLLAFELVGVRKVLQVASATGPEMAAQRCGHGSDQWTSTSSTSKNNVAFGGMTPPTALKP